MPLICVVKVQNVCNNKPSAKTYAIIVQMRGGGGTVLCTPLVSQSYHAFSASVKALYTILTLLSLLLNENCAFFFQELSKELDGFSRLFDRFLNEKGPSIDWDRIEPLPEGAVRAI